MIDVHKDPYRLTNLDGLGCLGSHLVEVLHEKREELGVTAIVVLDLQSDVRWATSEENARIKGYCESWIVGSILDVNVVARAICGCDAVIHTASAVDTGTVSKELLFSVNVKGTEALIEACMNESSVKAFVYCSSMDAITSHVDFHDMDGLNEEQLPLAIDNPEIDCTKDVYAITKALSEKRTLRANACFENPGLCTGVIRPVGLYGERDTVHMGIIYETGRDVGKAMVIKFGDGSAVFQHVYARNCAWMHALLAKKLVERDPQAAGQVFFGIDNTKVVNFFEFFRPYLAAKQYRIQTVGIPEWILYPLFAFAEDVFLLLRAVAPSMMKGFSLKLSRRAIQGSCVTAWFHTDKAKRLLGYEPLCTPMESRSRTISHFQTAMMSGLFPIGSCNYKFEDYNYLDDGKDYRPNDEKYLKRREENAKEQRRTGKPVDRYPLKKTRFYLLVGGAIYVIASKVLRPN